jgi:CRISPR-associated protein Cmr5
METKEPTRRNKLEQGRAEFAFNCAKTASEKSDIADEYKQYAKKLPMMIKTNGLGASLAFYFSKAKNKSGSKTAYGYLLEDIGKWLKRPENSHLISLSEKAEGGELLREIVGMDSPQYKSLTVEVLAYLLWLRRFADGIIKSK